MNHFRSPYIAALIRMAENLIFVEETEPEEEIHDLIEENRQLLASVLFYSVENKNAHFAGVIFQYFGDCRQEYHEIMKFARRKMEKEFVVLVMAEALKNLFIKLCDGQISAENVEKVNGMCKRA